MSKKEGYYYLLGCLLDGTVQWLNFREIEEFVAFINSLPDTTVKSHIQDMLKSGSVRAEQLLDSFIHLGSEVV